MALNGKLFYGEFGSGEPSLSPYFILSIQPVIDILRPSRPNLNHDHFALEIKRFNRMRYISTSIEICFIERLTMPTVLIKYDLIG